MKVLVTGGAGFIGSHIANHFGSKGYNVLVFDNLSREGTNKNVDWLRQNKNIMFVKGDVRNFDTLKPHMKDTELIIHTAAQVAVTTSFKTPREDFEINAMGTFNVLEAARQANTNPTIVYFSTNKVYGSNVNNIKLAEKKTRYEFDQKGFEFGIPEQFHTDTNNHTPYGISKYMGELYARDYSYNFGLNTVCFRCSCMYGPRQFGNEDQGWVAHFIISSILNRPITIYGDGKQARDVLFVDDVTKLIETATKKIRRIKGETFNIGGGPNNTISLLELIHIIENNLSKKTKYTFSKWRPADQKVYVSDIRKAEKMIGWKPLIDPVTGINKLIDWVKENKSIFN